MRLCKTHSVDFTNKVSLILRSTEVSKNPTLMYRFTGHRSQDDQYVTFKFPLRDVCDDLRINSRPLMAKIGRDSMILSPGVRYCCCFQEKGSTFLEVILQLKPNSVT